MTEPNLFSEDQPLGVNIEYAASFFGNRRTVVETFLTEKSKDIETFKANQLNVFELIELQLGYPIPTKALKELDLH